MTSTPTPSKSKVPLAKEGLTVGGLIELLQTFDIDLPVATDNGDNRLPITSESVREESGYECPEWKYRKWIDEGEGHLLTIGY